MSQTTYQVRLTDRNGRGEFAYFTVTPLDLLSVAAVKAANEFLSAKRLTDKKNSWQTDYKYYKPYEDIYVVEYDVQGQRVKRKGFKFQLCLQQNTLFNDVPGSWYMYVKPN